MDTLSWPECWPILIRPQLVLLYVWLTRVASRIGICVIQAKCLYCTIENLTKEEVYKKEIPTKYKLKINV